MEIDKEVNRVRKNKSIQPAQRPPQQRGSARGRARRGPTTATTPETLQAPTKKAVSAAVRAMKEFGFQPPKGMDVVISFAPKEIKTPNFTAATKTSTTTASNAGRTIVNPGRGGGWRRGGRRGGRGGGRRSMNNDVNMG
jgi:hypothetical protein